MRKPRIDLPKMRALLRQGKTQGQVAEYFKVTRSAISQAVKNLSKDVTKITSLELAGHVVNSELNVVDQLGKINAASDYLLDVVLRWLKGDKEAIEDLKRQHKEGKGIAFTDPSKVLLQTVGEIRKNIKVQVDILQILHGVESVMNFQTEVLTVIGEVEPKIKDEILFRLKEKRLLRQATTFRG